MAKNSNVDAKNTADIKKVSLVDLFLRGAGSDGEGPALFSLSMSCMASLKPSIALDLYTYENGKLSFAVSVYASG